MARSTPCSSANPAQACAIGRASKTVREFLEKNYTEELDRAATIKLAIKSLLEVVQTGAKNIEISVMESYGVVKVGVVKGRYARAMGLPADPLQSLEQTEIEAIVAEIEAEKEAEAERKRARLAATQAGQASMFASSLSGPATGATTPAVGETGGATVPGEESGVQ